MDPATSWSWGAGVVIGRFLVFETKNAEGGYKCKFCDKELNKRWDGLILHLTKCKNKPGDFDKKQHGKIYKIKVKCEFCNKALDLTGKKEIQHLNQCKNYKSTIQNQPPTVEEPESMQVAAAPMIINSNLVVERAVLADKDNIGDKFNAVGDIIKKANAELQKASAAWVCKEGISKRK